jgi:hypothetical protein
MNSTWNVLDWNLRGINSQERWDDINNELKNAVAISCAPRKLREFFFTRHTSIFCHRKFNKYAYIPYIGSSGGVITIWNGSLFDGIITCRTSCKNGISQTSMHHTIKRIDQILLTGLHNWIPPTTNSG